MKTIIIAALFSMALFSITTSAQNTDEDDVVKITSKLVQLDVVITDSKGNQITDLKSSDFTVLQDGKPQTLSGFSYIPIGRTAEVPKAQKPAKTAPMIPTGRPRADVRGRVITFVIDDGNCRASAEGMRASREALEKFVAEQMQPDDVIAIYQTRSGSSMFQQYTSDKTQLLRIVRKIAWKPPSGGCASNDGTFYEAAREDTIAIPTAGGMQSISTETEAERKRREMSEDHGRDHQVVGTIGVLRFAIRGLERIPGRKVLFLMSDGMPFRGRDGHLLDAVERFRDLTEMANRAGVVVNTLDVRGTFDVDMIEARDHVSVRENVLASEAIRNERRSYVQSTQDGLAFIANETGGNFYKGENYLDGPVARALQTEKGYYLVAYEPDDETFKGKNFNKIEIRLTRPGLKVISRTGFLGYADRASKAPVKTGDSELYEAIVAPLPVAGMNLRLTAYFGNSVAEGNFVRAQVHIPGDDISFVDAGERKKAAFDVVAVTMNERNEVVDEFTYSHSVNVEAAALPLIAKNGLVYSADVKVKKPGFYNFRIAMRDTASRRLGSAGQAVQIPELKPGRIYVSGLTVSAVNAEGKFDVPAGVKAEAAFSLAAAASVPAIRQFRRGSVIAYPYTVYNARSVNGGRPNLTVRLNLYHNGKLAIEGKPQPADLQPQSDWSRISDYGYLKLNPNLATGDYVLEVIVTDLSASGKSATSNQWMDFEIVD
jgi:VWFA-related protein